MMERSQQSNFLELRRRLAELNYTEPFGVDAIGLVERLLSDLVGTTQSYQQLQEKEGRLGSDLNLAQAQLFPLRKENARLARENHELHVESIRLNDELRSSLEDYGNNTRHLQDELNELRYLADSQKQQLKAKDEVIDRLRDAYESATDPSLQGQTSSAAATTKVMKISSKLSSARKYDNLPVPLQEAREELKALGTSPAKPRSSDAAATAAATKGKLQEAETIIQTLREQLDNANSALADAEEESKKLQSAIASREQEISRSSKLISSVSSGYGNGGNSSGTALLLGSKADQLMAADISNKRIIDQLNSQVDFLNEQLAQREGQLLENNDKIMQFDTLKLELDHRSSLLEHIRQDASTSNGRVRALESKILQLQEQLRNNVKEVSHSALPASESKDHPTDASELTLVLSKLSVENTQLREEIANLNNQLTDSMSVSNAATAGGRGGGGTNLDRKRGTGSSAVKAVPSRGTTASARSFRGKAGTFDASRQEVGDSALLQDLSNQVEDLNKKMHVMKRSLSQREEHIGALEAEKSDLLHKMEATNSPSSKSRLQQMYAELQEKFSANEHLLAESTRDRVNLKALADATQREIEALREALRASQEAADDANFQHAVVSKELDLCREQSTKQRTELDATSSEASKLRIELADLSRAAEQENSKGTLLQRKLASLQQQLDARSAELSEATEQLSRHQQGSVSGSSVLEQLRADKNRLQNQLYELESDQQIWFRERKFLLRLAEDLGVQYREEKTLRGQLEEYEMQELLDAARGKEAEIRRLRVQCEDMQSTIYRTESTARDKDTLLTVQLTELEELRRKYEQQSHMSYQYESDILLLQRRYEELQTRYEDAIATEADGQSATHSLGAQLIDVRRDLQLRNEEFSKLQLRFERVAEERDSCQREMKTLSKRSTNDRDDLRECIAEKDALRAKVEELKLLVGKLEGSLRLNAQKQSGLAAAVSRGETEASEWEQERRRLLMCIKEREEKINDQLSALQTLDKERDRIQDLLDAAEEQAQEYETLQQHQQKQITGYMQVIEQLERKMQELSADLTSSQRQSAAAEARLNSAATEVAELKRRVGQKSVEVGGAAEDLMLMTRENQALTADIVEITAERDQLHRKVQELLHAGARTEYSRRAVEVERSDLISTYRTVLQEKRKLEEDMNNASSQKQKDSACHQQLLDEIAQLRALLEQQTQSEARWRTERSSFQVQIENLRDQLLRAQRKYESMEAENRRMMNDAMGLRQSNALLNERINMIIKRASAATEANKLLTERMAAVERERDAVRALVHIERQRASDMSNIAEAARVQAATKELHIQRLRSAPMETGSSSRSSSASKDPKQSSPSSTESSDSNGSSSERSAVVHQSNDGAGSSTRQENFRSTTRATTTSSHVTNSTISATKR